MTKKKLRKEFSDKRKLLLPKECSALVEKILLQFKNIKLEKVDFAMSFINMVEKNEVDPAAIETELIKQYPECRLCYPKIQSKKYSMEAILHEEGMTMATNELGISEPVSGNHTHPQLLDVILVPLLAFDNKGYRVGYGKGFYDRYIARCRRDVITIGLSFFEPVESIADIDEYDIPLKYCITPQQLYQFK